MWQLRRWLAVIGLSLWRLTTGTAQADDPPQESVDLAPITSEQEALAVDTAQYAEAFGIELEEAQIRLAELRQLTELVTKVEALAPARFAAGFIDHEPEFRAVIRFTGEDPLDATATRAVSGVELLTVEMGAPHTLTELRSAHERILPIVHEAYPLMGSWVDERAGSIALSGPYELTAEQLSDLEAAAGGVPVRAETSAPTEPDHTYGGKLIDKLVNGELRGCTTGFTVKDAVSGVTGVLTAGHCSDDAWANGDPTYHESGSIAYLADLSGVRWDRNQDFAWYQTSHVEYPQFFSGGSMRQQSGTQPRLEMEDNPVCHYGIGSDAVSGQNGYSCGIVETIHFNPGATYCNGGPCDSVWVKAVVGGGYDLDCRRGDSGGPHFWGTTAWGTHSGSKTTGGGEDCVHVVFMSVGALQWDAVNTRILLP